MPSQPENCGLDMSTFGIVNILELDVSTRNIKNKRPTSLKKTNLCVHTDLCIIYSFTSTCGILIGKQISKFHMLRLYTMTASHMKY